MFKLVAFNKEAKQLYYLYVYATSNPDYFLHILMVENARLEELDNFLRDIWVECCGHLSSFVHFGSRRKINMKKKIFEIFKPGSALSYMYDFGDTTEA